MSISKSLEQTDKLFFDTNVTTSFLQNCLINRSDCFVEQNTEISIKNNFYEIVKTKVKLFSICQIKREVDQREHSMKSWKDYQF